MYFAAYQVASCVWVHGWQVPGVPRLCPLLRAGIILERNYPTDWFTAGNWAPTSVPTVNDIVQIDTITPNATIIAGGTAVAAGSDIGNIRGSPQGAVLVTGIGASWSNVGLLSVGTSGTGTLTIANGGVVSNGGASGFIAYTNGSQGTVIVTGPGSTWNISPTDPNGGLRVGGSSLNSGFLPPGPGTGTLTVANGGTVNVFGGAQTSLSPSPRVQPER